MGLSESWEGALSFGEEGAITISVPFPFLSLSLSYSWSSSCRAEGHRNTRAASRESRRCPNNSFSDGLSETFLPDVENVLLGSDSNIILVGFPLGSIIFCTFHCITAAAGLPTYQPTYTVLSTAMKCTWSSFIWPGKPGLNRGNLSNRT